MIISGSYLLMNKQGFCAPPPPQKKKQLLHQNRWKKNRPSLHPATGRPVLLVRNHLKMSKITIHPPIPTELDSKGPYFFDGVEDLWRWMFSVEKNNPRKPCGFIEPQLFTILQYTPILKSKKAENSTLEHFSFNDVYRFFNHV